MNTQDYYRCFNQCLQNLKNTAKKKGKRAKAKIDNSALQEVCKELPAQTLSLKEYIDNNYPFYYLVECEKAGDVIQNGLLPDSSGAIFVFRSLGRIQTVLGPKCINKYRIFKISPKTLRLSPNDIYEVELPYGWDILVNYIKKDKITFSRQDIMGDIDVFEPDDTESMLREQLYLDGYSHSKIRYDGDLDVTLFGSYLKDIKYKTWDNSFTLKEHVIELLDLAWYSVDYSTMPSTKRDYNDYYKICLISGVSFETVTRQLMTIQSVDSLDCKSIIEIGHKYAQQIISEIEVQIEDCRKNKTEINKFLSTCYEDRLNQNRSSITNWSIVVIELKRLISLFILRIETKASPLKLDIDYTSKLDSLLNLLPTQADLDGITPKKVGFWQKVLWFLVALARS
ncbi:MAG: hypothetical protein ACI3Z0_00155 [Candidatus Cryptobacteroides sp.]